VRDATNKGGKAGRQSADKKGTQNKRKTGKVVTRDKRCGSKGVKRKLVRSEKVNHPRQPAKVGGEEPWRTGGTAVTKLNENLKRGLGTTSVITLPYIISRHLK